MKTSRFEWLFDPLRHSVEPIPRRANASAGQFPGTSLDASTLQKKQLLLPYPQYTDVTISNDPEGNSYFDAMEVRLEKHMSHEVRFLLNYERPKKLDRVGYLNPQDAAPVKQISADDRPQHFVRR